MVCRMFLFVVVSEHNWDDEADDFTVETLEVELGDEDADEDVDDEEEDEMRQQTSPVPLLLPDALLLSIELFDLTAASDDTFCC